MKTRIETFIKKTSDEKDNTVIRRLVIEEEFKATIEEIERMEKNAQTQINNANSLIEEMNAKLEECQKLRDMIPKEKIIINNL
jgi:uncharacterized protein (UPF0335 family)